MDDLTNDAQRKLHKEEARGRKEQAAGAFDEVKGKIKKNVGDAIDDHSMEARGAAEEMAGKARKTAGDAYADTADKAEDAIDKRH
ncbi:CsbD family protein [Rubrivirga sp. IMCC43871]|uniref:CsbD family protein n=1 Tax=Rubrivirga sp. IMCC43871 TaxID=3391575 RepID=UPI00398F9A4E